MMRPSVSSVFTTLVGVVLSMLTACTAPDDTTVIGPVAPERFLSVKVDVPERKRDGLDWDHGGGPMMAFAGPFATGEIAALSAYPDLALHVLEPDGTTRAYEGPRNRWGILDGACINRLSCRFDDVEVPAEGSYALIASDVDFWLNTDKLLGQDTDEGWFRTTRDFAGALIVTGDDGVADDLERQVRAWMKTARIEMAPTVGLTRVPRDGCRVHVCPEDEANPATFAIYAMPAQSRADTTEGGPP